MIRCESRRERRSTLMAVATLAAASVPAGLFAQAGVQDAIVKVYTVSQSPDYYNPWSMSAIASSSGSAAIISGRRILTNAHVVSNQRLIEVRRNGDPRKYVAQLQSISHEADLALLTVSDPDFFADAKPLELGELPQIQQEVLVYGFPMGGDVLSITKGVVSRVEHQTYTHSSKTFLAAQVDAAINPGNSGGPVIVAGRMVGVSMQSYNIAQGLGYMVPSSMVAHFLKDMEDGRYDGFPSIGVDWQPMENPDLKRKYAVPAERTGVLVIGVVPGSPVAEELKRGDVLLAIDGHAIADDGTVEFRRGERTQWSYFLDQQQIGAVVGCEVLRSGRVEKRSLRLAAPQYSLQLVPDEQYDEPPKYFIYGGLVFSSLSKNYLQAWGPDWYRNAPQALTARLERRPAIAGEEIVILVKVLAAAVNRGYHDLGSMVVESVNGTKVRNIEDLIRRVEDDGAAPFVAFTADDGREIVLDRQKVRASQQEILATYHITAERSPDVRQRTDPAPGS
jgi:S1-C subfamily serine protease